MGDQDENAHRRVLCIGFTRLDPEDANKWQRMLRGHFKSESTLSRLTPLATVGTSEFTLNHTNRPNLNVLKR